jgi:hypothetical protein
MTLRAINIDGVPDRPEFKTISGHLRNLVIDVFVFCPPEDPETQPKACRTRIFTTILERLSWTTRARISLPPLVRTDGGYRRHEARKTRQQPADQLVLF